MCNLNIKRSRVLEIFPKAANAGKTQLPPDDFLEGKTITAAVAYNVTQIPVGPQSGSVLQTDDIFKHSFLTLVKGSDEIIAQIPLLQLNPTYNNGLIREITLPRGADKGQSFSLTKSYITCQTAPGVAAIWLLEFYYED